MTWTAHVLTLFPDMFPGPLGFSLANKALQEGIWSLKAYNIRDFATDLHRTVDDTPFGGGHGMVLKADVVGSALVKVSEFVGKKVRYLYLSPRGEVLSQTKLQLLSEQDDVVLLCGRYEGVDQRVLEAWPIEEVSVGDYILSGGEIAALAIIDGVVRLLDDVMGQKASLEEESFQGHLLEYPHYTKPRSWNGLEVPEVLLSGHHHQIASWRLAQAEALTKQRRPDLWEQYCRSKS